MLNELKIAHEELNLHHKELEKCAHDLKIANSNLVKEKTEKVIRINDVNNTLSDMMFTVSHRIRQSVANILGISELLRTNKDLTPEDLNEMLDIIIHSAKSLNIATEELSKFIHLKKIKE